MSAEEASDTDPFARTFDRLHAMEQDRREEHAEKSRREQQRQAAISRFRSDRPLPPLLQGAECRAWADAVMTAAIRLFPQGKDDPPDIDAASFFGIDDVSGESFRRQYQRLVAETAENEIVGERIRDVLEGRARIADLDCRVSDEQVRERIDALLKKYESNPLHEFIVLSEKLKALLASYRTALPGIGPAPVSVNGFSSNPRSDTQGTPEQTTDRPSSGGSGPVPRRLLFATRSDLTPEQRRNKDYLLEVLEKIDREKNDLKIDEQFDRAFGGREGRDPDAARERHAKLLDLDELERDTLAALQEYSALPRRHLTAEYRSSPQSRTDDQGPQDPPASPEMIQYGGTTSRPPQVGHETRPNHPLDYSLPDLPIGDLILEARRRMKDAPREVAFPAVSPEHWQGDSDQALRFRASMVKWSQSSADPDRLLALGWPPLAIAVWCYPYTFDVHFAADDSKTDAAKACLRRLEIDGWRHDATRQGPSFGDADMRPRPPHSGQLRLRVTWPDGPEAEWTVSRQEADAVVASLGAWRHQLEVKLQRAETTSVGDADALNEIARLRAEADRLPRISIVTRDGAAPTRAPRLRPPTDDDRAFFEQEGTWGHLGRAARWDAIERSLRVAAEAPSDQAIARAASFDGQQMLRAVDEGDVEAWRRIWYLCRGVVPPNGPGSTRGESDGASDRRNPQPGVRRDDERVKLLGQLADAIVDRDYWRLSADGSDVLPTPEQRRELVKARLTELKQTSTVSPDEIEAQIRAVRAEGHSWKLRSGTVGAEIWAIGAPNEPYFSGQGFPSLGPGASRGSGESGADDRSIPPTVVEVADHLPTELTRRQREILGHWRKNMTESEIAVKLGIAPDSVAKRISEMRRRHGDSVVPRRRPSRLPAGGLPDAPGTSA